MTITIMDKLNNGQSRSSFVGNASMNSISFLENKTCRPTEYDDYQYIIVVYIGLPICVLGLISNILLVKLFRGKNNCQTTDVYFLVLAFLDIGICLLYILLFVVDVLAIYHTIFPLWQLWTIYIVPFLAFSRIIQLTLTYIVVAATVERFFIVVKYKIFAKSFYTPRNRIYSIIGVFFVTSLIRLPSFWDYQLLPPNHCIPKDNFSTFAIVNLLMAEYGYKTYYNFYFMHIVQVFIPVITLIMLNVNIVYHLRHQLKLAKRFACLFPGNVLTQGVIKKGLSKDKIRKATYSLLAIVTSYLACNTVNLFLSIMEHLFKVPYLEDEHGVTTALYNYLIDAVSFLYMFNSSTRLFVHLASNDALRRQIIELIYLKEKPSQNGTTSTLVCRRINNEVVTTILRNTEIGEMDTYKETKI